MHRQQAEREGDQAIGDQGNVLIAGAGADREADPDRARMSSKASGEEVWLSAWVSGIDADLHRRAAIPADRAAGGEGERRPQPAEAVRRHLPEQEDRQRKIDGRHDPQPLEPERPRLAHRPEAEEHDEADDDSGIR